MTTLSPNTTFISLAQSLSATGISGGKLSLAAVITIGRCRKFRGGVSEVDFPIQVT